MSKLENLSDTNYIKLTNTIEEKPIQWQISENSYPITKTF